MSEEKLKRVILEDEDGTAKYVEGDEAEKWLERVAGLEGLAYAHGDPGVKFDWKKAVVEEVVRAPGIILVTFEFLDEEATP